MKIEKFTPSAALTPFVREYMIIESDHETSSKTIPDTSLVMSFRYKGGIQPGESSGMLPAGVVSGLRRSGRAFHYDGDTANLLVILREGGISAFTRMPAHELFEQSITSENLFPASDVAEILERLAEAPGHPQRIRIIESFLFKKSIARREDLLIDTAVQRIRQHSGLLRIRDLSASLYISQDAFEKRFRARVGATPKQYASIVRLRNLIRKHTSYPSLTEASYEAGYFDQSHFIRDFRLFTGQTPGDFFREQRFW
ncbi:helix-turn-helix domain-containing protein [Chitinophaga cymbidii]|uniref:AraC family transcriptional regulator n=1 Tax=Chitinophaga cymbidii TaxID=1096750 RepID=A0A512RGD2_9BACT|nr:helix-turn-helix domain-containing protein [Chitinophaga cymbidii]GEP94718.1 AraC family transcriptional regulator [Chitinophaga cymbidii]